MNRVLLPILALILVGCATPQRSNPTDGAALAQAQELGEVALDTLKDSSPFVSRDTVVKVLEKQQTRFSQAVGDYLRMAREKNDAIDAKNEAVLALAFEQSRPFSKRQRDAGWRLWLAVSLIGLTLFLISPKWGISIAKWLWGRVLALVEAIRNLRSAPPTPDPGKVNVVATNVPAGAVEVTRASKRPKPKKRKSK